MADAALNKNFQFELVSPERLLASEEASLVIIPGEDGDFGVLAEHAPLLSSIRPGVVTVQAASGETKKIFVSGGFADVGPKICAVLAEEAVNVDDLDKAVLDQELKAMNDQLSNLKEDDDVNRALIEHKIASITAKISAVS